MCHIRGDFLGSLYALCKINNFYWDMCFIIVTKIKLPTSLYQEFESILFPDSKRLTRLDLKNVAHKIVTFLVLVFGVSGKVCDV